MNKYDKHYFERYAELTLYGIFPEWNSHFTRSDRPDLQNEIDDIGIEVTSSTPTRIREVAAFGAKLLGGKVSIKDEEKFRGELYLTPERIAYAYSPTKGLVDADRCPEIVAAIAQKRSIWKDYKDFCTRGIYIFTGTSLIDDKMLRKIEKSGAFPFFHMVFINAIDRIYYKDNGNWKMKEFTDEELSEFKKQALEINSPIFKMR